MVTFLGILYIWYIADCCYVRGFFHYALPYTTKRTFALRRNSNSSSVPVPGASGASRRLHYELHYAWGSDLNSPSTPADGQLELVTPVMAVEEQDVEELTNPESIRQLQRSWPVMLVPDTHGPFTYLVNILSEFLTLYCALYLMHFAEMTVHRKQYAVAFLLLIPVVAGSRWYVVVKPIYHTINFLAKSHTCKLMFRT